MKKLRNYISTHKEETVVIVIGTVVAISTCAGFVLSYRAFLKQISRDALASAGRKGISLVCESLEKEGHLAALEDLISKGIVRRI